jgi:hypothetical protein
LSVCAVRKLEAYATDQHRGRVGLILPSAARVLNIADEAVEQYR